MASILSGVSSTVYFIWLLISIATPPLFSVLNFVSVEKPFIERRLFAWAWLQLISLSSIISGLFSKTNNLRSSFFDLIELQFQCRILSGLSISYVHFLRLLIFDDNVSLLLDDIYCYRYCVWLIFSLKLFVVVAIIW